MNKEDKNIFWYLWFGILYTGLAIYLMVYSAEFTDKLFLSIAMSIISFIALISGAYYLIKYHKYMINLVRRDKENDKM